jgi:hypothetical protein
LRTSQQTELADQFPPHVVTNGIGNFSDNVDRRSLESTDNHFKDAIAGQSAHEAEKAVRRATVGAESAA